MKITDEDVERFQLWDPNEDPGAFVWVEGTEGGSWWPSEMVTIGKPKRGPRKVQPQQRGPDRFLTLAEAGALVRASPETVRFWIWQGRLQAFKPGRAVLVRETELLALVEQRETRKIRAQRQTCGV